MNVKKYLQQIRIFDTRIRQKRDLYNEVHESALSVGAIKYDKEQVQTSKLGDALEKNVIRYLELEEQLEKESEELLNLKNKIINEIQSLDDDRFINILYKRYVEYKSYELIAVEMNYSFDYVKELHRDALIQFKVKHPTLSHF